MGLAIIGCFVIFFTWLINDTLEDPIRIYVLVSMIAVWIIFGLLSLGPELNSTCRSIKKKSKRTQEGPRNED